MSKRNLIIIFAVVVISLAGFGAAYASGSTQYSWPNTSNWNQCNCGWNNCCCNYYVPRNRHYVHLSLPMSPSWMDLISLREAHYKTWRIRNNGTTTWNTNYKLFFSSGSQMSGPSWVAMPYNVAPGQTVDLSVILSLPQAGLIAAIGSCSRIRASPSVSDPLVRFRSGSK